MVSDVLLCAVDGQLQQLCVISGPNALEQRYFSTSSERRHSISHRHRLAVPRMPKHDHWREHPAHGLHTTDRPYCRRNCWHRRWSRLRYHPVLCSRHPLLSPSPQSAEQRRKWTAPDDGVGESGVETSIREAVHPQQEGDVHVRWESGVGAEGGVPWRA